MKRYEIPKYVADRVKERIGDNEIYLYNIRPTNVEKAKELYHKLKELRTAISETRQWIKEFPEGFRVTQESHYIGVTYDKALNKAYLVTPTKIGKQIPINGLPTTMDEMTGEVILDVTRMDFFDWVILLDRIVEETRKWVEYLDEEV